MPRITVVFLVVLVFGPVAAGARADTEEGAHRGEITSAVARFIGVGEIDVALEPLSAASADWESGWSFIVRGPDNQAPRERGEAFYDERVGLLSRLVVSTRLSDSARIESGDTAPDGIRESAETVVRRCSPFDLSRLAQQGVRLVGGRVWAFLWEELDPASGARTGGRVGVGMSAATGQLVSYHAYYPPATAHLQDVAVGQEAARAVAAGLLAERGAAIQLSGVGKLYLSSPLVDGGPVWVFSIAAAEQWTDTIIIDARTGDPVRYAE